VARELPYRDHHWFDARDVERITAAAMEIGADVILTTEKDAMRLTHTLDGIPWAYLPMDVAIEPAAGFSDWLANRLDACRAAS